MAAKSFQGVVNVDIRDSVPDWSPFESPKAPDGAPNVVYITGGPKLLKAIDNRLRSAGARPAATGTKLQRALCSAP